MKTYSFNINQITTVLDVVKNDLDSLIERIEKGEGDYLFDYAYDDIDVMKAISAQFDESESVLLDAKIAKYESALRDLR